MQLNPIASGILVAFCILVLLGSLVLNALLLLALRKSNDFLEAYQSRVEQVLTKVDGILVIAEEKLVTIGGQTEAILEQGEELTTNVNERVEKTSVVLQRTVNAPLIGINSVWAGLTRGVKTFGSLQRDSIATASDEYRRANDNVQPIPQPVAIGK
jgi:hypothetical protein